MINTRLYFLYRWDSIKTFVLKKSNLITEEVLFVLLTPFPEYLNHYSGIDSGLV